MQKSTGLSGVSFVIPEEDRASWVAAGCGYLVPDSGTGWLRLLPKSHVESRLAEMRSRNMPEETLRVVGANVARVSIGGDGSFEIPDAMLKFAKITSGITFAAIDHGFLLKPDLEGGCRL